MRVEIIQLIKENEDWHDFIRKQPAWYRRLSREPSEFKQFEIAALNFHQKTIPHKVNKMSNNLQLASLMVNMLGSMKM